MIKLILILLKIKKKLINYLINIYSYYFYINKLF